VKPNFLLFSQASQGLSNGTFAAPWGPWSGSPVATSRALNSSAVILQNPIDEQGATSIESFWKGDTNHESLRSTEPNDAK